MATRAASTIYFDTSALVTLVSQEEHSDALQQWLTGSEVRLVSSLLLHTEALRVAHRLTADAVARTRALLDGVILLPITPDTCERAASLSPSSMRSLDAIHLATALGVVHEISGVLTYDERLAESCSAHGITVIAPT